MEEAVLESAMEGGFATSPAGTEEEDDYSLIFGHSREAETPVASKRRRVEVTMQK